MVFESIVVELINNYLGEFVQDLDKSQLSIGIWSAQQGDVVLKKLNLKETALERFNIPVKIKAGHLGKLTLKVPWKNLYSEPVVVHMQDIYALTVPNTAVQYDAEYDRQSQLAEKQARLAQIEVQKKWDADKAKPRDPKQDSFVEKLFVQIIKNLQIKVSGLHIRHEDAINNPMHPISIGFTLKELLFQTTDASWKETVIKEAVSQIYKLVRLDSLSMYWNSRSDLLLEKSKKIILSYLADNIPKLGGKSTHQHLFQPISAVAHVRLNTKPELMNLALPKIQLTLVFDEITVTLSKEQFDDILEMLESLERMALRNKYMATRPNVPYSGNAKLWWRHAYAVVLRHTVQRRHNMWKWHTMKKHRENVKDYRELYTQKLTNRKLSTKEIEKIARIEEELDILNICICRNQAELDVARMDKKRGEKGKVTKWFKSWFSNTGSEEDTLAVGRSQSYMSTEFNKFSEEFTDDEKGKLYKAIGYDENANDPTYPTEFVSVRLVVKLNKLSAVLMGKRNKDNPLLRMMLTEICASFGQRPAANAIRLDVKVDQLIAIGAPRSDYTPKLINSVGVSKEANISLFTVSLETNPLDNLCDTRVRISSRPLEMIYDAVTVNSLATFFRPPESVKLKQLSNAAMAKYDEIISQTTAGVIYMMSERKYADIEVHLMPSYIILPETGELKKDVRMLLLNLGSLNVTSEKNKEMPVGAQMSPKDLARYAYDKFNVSLENVQLLFVQPGDTWQNESQSINSPLYILQPMSMQILMEKCIFASDPNFPQFHMSGVLPLVAVTISDNKLLAILNLLQSIPLPTPPPETKVFEFDEDELFDDSRMTALHLTRLSWAKENNRFTSEYTNLTQLSMTFVIQEVLLEIRETISKTETPFLQFILTKIGANLKVRTFDLSLEVILGGIYLKHLQYKISDSIRHQLEKCQVVTGENVNIINSPFVEEDEPLLSVRFIQANKRGPEFKTTYNNTAQSVTVEFSTLDIVLHQGVLLSLLEFSKKFDMVGKQQSFSTQAADTHKKVTSTMSLISQRSFGYSEKNKLHADIQLLKVKAIVDNIQLSLCNAKCVIMHSSVEGIEFSIGMQHQTTGVTTLMRKIEVTDPDPMTYHPKIFSVQGTDMLKLELTYFKNLTKDFNNVDAILSLQMGRAQIVFVNKFCMSIVHFFDNFAVAKAKLDEARKLMQEASMDIAKNLHQTVPHVKLDVSIKAPLIVVPQNSRSQSVLNVHLGDVTVHNKFEHGAIKTKKDNWFVENMIVKLTNLCISRGIVQHGATNPAAEITVLEPLSFIVDIRRNLSSAYYHDIPSIEVKGVLEKIDIKLNQEDVRLIMQIATENVDERYADGPTSAKAKLVIVRDKRMAAKMRSPSTVASKLSVVARETYCALKLDFKLLAINIELYRGLVNLLETDAGKLPDKLLTYLALNTLRLSHTMSSDNAMVTSVYLHDISMDDCRQEKTGGITKLIRRTAFKSLTRAALKVRAKEAKENMVIYMNFEESSSKDKTINVHVCSLHLCVSLEFLMKVAEFFTKAVPVKDPDEINRTTEMKAILEHKDAVKDMKVVPPMVGSIDITIKLEKPEIYFIEDQMNPHTDSLIVNLELAFHMFMSQHTLTMNGGVSRFSLISCVFEKEDAKKSYFKYFKWSHDKTRKISSTEKELLEICYNYYEHKWEMLPILNYVLTPLDVTMVGSGPQSKDHHVDVVMTDFILSVTPSTVRLLTAIAASMNVSPETEAAQEKQKDYSHVWDKKELSKCNYWFTQSVEAEATALGDQRASTYDLTSSPSMTDAQTITILYIKEKFLQRKVRYYGNQIKEMLPRYLNLLVYAPVIVLQLEGGLGQRTVPLLIAESSVSAQIHNWSSDIYMKCTLGIEIAYNNENIGIWEPVLEPVVNIRKSTSRKWDINIEMVKNPVYDETSDDTLLPPPKMSVNIVANHPLQLVMSKTCLKVLYQIQEAFSEAYQLRECQGSLGQQVYPFQFCNLLGVNIHLIPDSSFEVVEESLSVDLNEFPSGKEVYMNIATKKVLFKDESLIRSTQPVEKMVSFLLEGSRTRYDVHIKQAKKRVFAFDETKVVVSVEVFLGQKIISFTSLVLIKNHLNVPIFIKYADDKKVDVAGDVYPGSSLPLPLKAVSCPNGQLFFQPKTEDCHFSACQEGVIWKNLVDTTIVTQIKCETVEKRQPSYYFNILPQFETIFEGNKRELAHKLITLHLHPTVILHNLLPFNVKMSLQGTSETHTLEAGQNIPLSHASVSESVLQVQIPAYRSHQWSGQIEITNTAPEMSILRFRSEASGLPIYMFLGLHCKANEGSLDITVYSPYWIVNLTNQDLTLKEHDKENLFTHTKEDKKVMLFYFEDVQALGDGLSEKAAEEGTSGCAGCLKRAKKPFKTPKRVSLKIASAEWSDKFSLDTVGSHGRIACVNNPKGPKLQVGVKIALSSSGLTKIVTFTPFYLLINASSVKLSVRENDTNDWIHLSPGECKSFYPKSVDKDVKVVAKVKESLNETVPFFVSKNHTTLLRLNDKFAGISVECQITESTTITIMKTYKPGMAPGLLVNCLSSTTVAIRQLGPASEVHVLEPNTSELYTWTDPTVKREVLWTCGNKKDMKCTLDRDKIEAFVMQNDVKFYFVSFLDGMQRVIMFTEDISTATLALEAGELEQAEQELNIKICEVGFSLVDNEERSDVLYMGITSSGVIWEQKKSIFKVFKPKEAENMEKLYQKFKVDDDFAKTTTSYVKLDNNMEIDFENMQTCKPYIASIRRSFEDGIWIQIRKSPHSVQFHAKINRLQIDNQQRECIFPTILSPMPLPKSVTLSNVPIPFIELCLITRIHRHSSLLQIKYFKVLIQEINVKIDRNFINGILNMFASDVSTLRERELTQFKEDVALTTRDLKEEAGISMYSMRVSFFDYFHISPIKINLSLSLQGGIQGDRAHSSILGIFLKGMGVVLIEVHDVVFKLGYFEKNYSFCDSTKLTKEFILHYSAQAMKQMYVLLFGFDFLGNPFGLLRGLTEGIEDLFYEPYQGAIQGPDEFVEGLSLGIRSLFGHTVGGTAGAVSKITGSVSRGLAALAFDKKYQQRRSEHYRKLPSNSREAFALGGKELVLGVYGGVTGIVTMPVAGARENGFPGFLKGVGMGLVGILIKPTSGILGFASRSLEGIRRLTDVREEIQHLRPPRTFTHDGVMAAYNYEEAEGCSLILEIDGGKYVDSDVYMAHVKLREENRTIKMVFIVTDRRIMLARRTNIFGVWNTEWMFTYDELEGFPEGTSKGIEFFIKDKEKRKIFKNDTYTKELAIPDPDMAEIIVLKIIEVMKTSGQMSDQRAPE